MDNTWWGYVLTTASLLILFATLIVYGLQLRTMKKQMAEMQKQIRDDHERSRGEETLRLMRFWGERVDAMPISLPNATKLCRKLEKGKLIALFEALPFDVPIS